MKVMLFSEYLKTIHNKEYQPNTICEINSIDSFPDGLVYIENKLARCCSFSIEKDFITIEYVNQPIDEDEIFQHNEIKCPYCGIEKSDSWEFGDDGIETCDTCGSEYEYERVVDVSYTTTICEINSIDSFPDGLVYIENKLARCCSFSIEKDFITIEYVNQPIDEDEIFQHNEIKCPYCGIEKSDSWEFGDDGIETCDTCGSEYEYERVVDVSYTTTIKKKNTNITNLK